MPKLNWLTITSPALVRAAAAPRPDYAEVEWLQRQRIMMERAAAQPYPADCDYRVDCRAAYSPSYYPYMPVALLAPFRPVVRPTFFTSSRPFGGSRPRASMMFR